MRFSLIHLLLLAAVAWLAWHMMNQRSTATAPMLAPTAQPANPSANPRGGQQSAAPQDLFQDLLTAFTKLAQGQTARASTTSSTI